MFTSAALAAALRASVVSPSACPAAPILAPAPAPVPAPPSVRPAPLLVLLILGTGARGFDDEDAGAEERVRPG